MRDVVVVGSLNADVSFRVPAIPGPGEEVRAEDVRIGPGGKGVNQAVAAARAGARVHMVGRVGDDPFAEVPLAALRAAGVDAAHVHRLRGRHTGVAAVLVERAGGQNAIASAAGATAALTPDDVRDAIAVFRASGVLLVQLGPPLETVETALDVAGECGLTTILDPAPVRELPDRILRKVSILTPNASEASFLSGVEVRDVESALAAGMRLRDRTLSDVVVTLGAEGCIWLWSSGFEHLPSPRVASIDSTGAGDAFNGALAAALARGDALARALERALRAAADSTLRRGAAESMPAGLD